MTSGVLTSAACARLEPRGEVHGVAIGHEVAKLLAPDIANECRTGRDAVAETGTRARRMNDSGTPVKCSPPIR
jgi:hypothetical protein